MLPLDDVSFCSAAAAAFVVTFMSTASSATAESVIMSCVRERGTHYHSTLASCTQQQCNMQCGSCSRVCAPTVTREQSVGWRAPN